MHRCTVVLAVTDVLRLGVLNVVVARAVVHGIVGRRPGRQDGDLERGVALLLGVDDRVIALLKRKEEMADQLYT